MILEEVFKADMNLLGHNLLKVVEVDLRSGAFFEVKVSDGETVKRDGTVNQWVNDFIDGGNIHNADVWRVVDFFDLKEIEEYLKDNWMKRIFYRRKLDNKWRYVSAEFIKLGKSFEEDGFALLVIRDIEDYILDFKRQVGSYDYKEV